MSSFVRKFDNWQKLSFLSTKTYELSPGKVATPVGIAAWETALTQTPNGFIKKIRQQTK